MALPGKYSFLLLLLLSFAPSLLRSQVYNLLGGNTDDYSQSGCVLNDSTLLAFGNTGSLNSEDAMLVFTDYSGKIRKSMQFGGNGTETGMSVCSTGDGGFAVTGSTRSAGAGARDIFVYRFNAKHEAMWGRVYGGSNDDESQEIIFTSDHGFLVAGYTRSWGNTSYNSYIIKLDSTGKPQWNKVFYTNSTDIAYRVLEHEGAYYVTGNVNISSAFGKGDVHLMKLSPGGQLLWNRAIGTVQNDQNWKIKPTLDGHLAMTCASVGYSGSSKKELLLMKMDTAGKLIFTTRVVYPGKASDGFDFVQDRDSSFIVAGHAEDALNEWKGAIYRFDKNGVLKRFVMTAFSTEGNFWSVHKLGTGFVFFGNGIHSSRKNRDFMIAVADSSLRFSCQNVTEIHPNSEFVTPGEKYQNAYFNTTSGLTLDTLGWNLRVNPSNLNTVELNLKAGMQSSLPNYIFRCEFDSLILNPGFQDAYLWNHGSTERIRTIRDFGTYSLKFWKNHCVGYDSVIVSKAAPVALSLRSDTCARAPVKLTVQKISSWKYLWSTGETGNEITTGTPGKYYIQVHDTVRNCLSRDSVQIFNPGMVLNVTTDTVLNCYRHNRFQARSEPAADIRGDSVISLTWWVNESLSGHMKNLDYTATDTGDYRILMAGKTRLGCTDTFTFAFPVYPDPLARFGIKDSTFCSKILSTQCYNQSLSADQILWKLPQGVEYGSDTIAPVFSGPGKHSVTLIASTDKGCRDSVSKDITILESPAIHAALLTEERQCLNGNLFQWKDSSRIPQGDSNLMYYWETGDGSLYQEKSPKHSYAKYGSYKVRQVIVAGNGCSDTGFTAVEVFPNPRARLRSSSNLLCAENHVFVFYDQTSIDEGNFSNSISFGDGNFGVFADSIRHSYSDSGTYRVQLSVYSGQGCFDSASTTVRVAPQPQTEILVNDSGQCRKDNHFLFHLNNSSFRGSLQTAWQTGDGSDYNGDTLGHSYKDHGSYSVTAISRSCEGCVDTARILIRVYKDPIALFDSLALCLGEKAVFRDRSEPGDGRIVLHEWFSDGVTVQVPRFEHTYKSPGFYSTTLVVTDENGCRDSLILNRAALVRSLPEAAILWQILEETLEEDVWQGQATGNGLVYHYWESDRGDAGYEDKFRISVKDSVVIGFTYIGTDSFGCRDTVVFSRIFPFRAYVFIPNAFTPDGNAINAVFRPRLDKSVKHYDMQIYNRWGQMIYSGHDPFAGWDGTYNGRAAEDGVYVYVIRIGDQYLFRGTVHLIR